MRLIPERSPLPRLLVLPLAALAAFAILWLRWRPEFVLSLARCPLKDATGLPCPTCGSTSAAAALAAGNLTAAWSANPLAVALAAGFVISAAAALAATAIPSMWRTLVLTRGEKRAAGFLATLVLLVVWVWRIVNPQ